MNPVMPWKREDTVKRLALGGEADAPRPATPTASAAQDPPAKPLRAIVIALAVSAGLWALIAHFL
jgi:hypothetical protein